MKYTFKDKDYFINVRLYKNVIQNYSYLYKYRDDPNEKIKENSFKIETIEDSDLDITVKVERSIYVGYQVVLTYLDNSEKYALPLNEYCNYDGSQYDDDILKDTVNKFANDIEKLWNK
jgi:hypothetical protein